MTGPSGPLTGIRVLEMTTAWAGPMAGRVLGFLGAEVIHVEAAARVNSWRAHRETVNTRYYPDRERGERPYNRTFLFNSQNINKLSVTLDLKKPGGADALFGLAVKSDVLICNFRPGTLEKAGLSYDRLHARNPGIVIVEMPAFGLDGPLSSHAALGPTMEMAAGMSSMIGYPGEAPVVTGPSYLDPIGAYHGAAAALTALLQRQQTGEGRHVEVPQVEAAMHFIGEILLEAAVTGVDPVLQGNHVAWAAPHDAFPASGEDEWIAVAAQDDAAWRRLCDVIGRPALADDARFATLADRLRHQDALYDVIAAWTSRYGKHQAAAMLQAAGVAAAPVQNPKDLAESEYLAARGFFTELDHPEAGRHPYSSLPIHLDRDPGSQWRAAPCFGEHTESVLHSVLGLSDAALTALADGGALSDVPLT